MANPSITPQPVDTLIEEYHQAVGILKSIYYQLPTILSRLLMAGIIIVLGLLALRLFKKLISKRLRRKSKTRNRTARQAETVRSLITSVVSYLAYFFIALIVLRIFGIDLTSLLAVAGIGSIAIGFGAQSLVKDIISGMFLWFEGSLNVGDIVNVANCNGRVESMSLRTTTLRGTDGSLFTVPNGDIRTVVCRSRGQQIAQVNITVAHGQDLTAAQQALEDECRLLTERLERKQPLYLLPAIQSDARCVTMRIEASCESEEAWALEREIRMCMFERLRKEDIKP